MTGQRFDRTVSWTGPATALTAVLLSVAGCGSTGAGTSPDPGPAATAVEPAVTRPAPSAAATKAAAPAKVEVPRGVGLDYQSAQDLWRAAGLHVSPAEDATGANRIPVIDANWVVVSQSPKAGAMVDGGSFITATVKKNTDD